ncbi:MAG: cysteine--1-D-myo-inosityl 2-amino-2-deoxy-alpha-D-glucopyranoside ligase [Candidatus Nanopelagicales bacterium]|nr:cysteine--1-D-myo-inosityl 2-amino-2-deoxy-alpha-D-glucopyranoside ligase [Candidatus Nanopelagicales bacterium]
MDSWAAPSVPKLPGTGPALQLFDTATQQVRATAPGPTARMYVCGITPYDATHMGHAATYVAFDLVYRAWLDAGHDVHYVQNVTDIDDPLLERAVERGEDWRTIALRETALFREDMTALNVIPPREYIGAVEAIPSVAEYVLQLQSQGSVYAVDNDLYFSVHADPTFGSVANLDHARMLEIFAERGGDPDRPGKRDPLDCLVWQDARPDEPAWNTPLGHGRPGWHIECVAIALDHLGPTIDVQGGGSDLAFPHHEMGASEAQVLTGQTYAQHYVHAGMVGWQGHKMSKSRGNLVFVSQLRHSGVDPMAIRLALLAHHYRTDWAWTPHGLEGATDRLSLWRMGAAAAKGPDFAPYLERMRRHLSNDLRTPEVLDVVDTWAAAASDDTGDSADAPALMQAAVLALLGVSL